MSTQSNPYPNPSCDACECNANAGCGGERCPANAADGTVEEAHSYVPTAGEGNFKLSYYNGWKLDGAPTDYVGPVGYNWSIDAFPYVTTGENDTLVFIWAPGRQGKAVWFSQSGSTYTAQFGARQTCTEDGDTWRVADPDGTVWVFSMEDELLTKMISPGGVETHYEITDGRIVEKWREIDGEVESRKFDYSGGKLVAVVLYRGTDLNHFATPVRQVLFTYYDSTLTDKGNAGDLKIVTEQVYDGSGWQVLTSRYYRYYTQVLYNSETETYFGFVHGLRYVVGPTAYASLGGSPDSVSNGTIAGLAETYYEYDPDTRRVTKAATHGGTIEFTLEYEEAPHGVTGYNDWQLKAEMTLPDGATKTVFSNHAGRDLLVDHNSSSGRWIHYNKYNAQGHLEWQVEPSAIDMTGTPNPPYNDSEPDLDVQFNDNTGLIHVTTYYMSTGSGAAEGYPDLQQVQQGKLGTPISISKTEYISHSAGSGSTLSTIYPVWKQTIYKSDADGGSSPVVTEYDYTWHSGTNQPATITTNLPDIGSGQNGGTWLTDQTRVQTFDILGRLVSSTDARGTVTTYDYDDATDTLLQMVQDPGSGHLNIITDYESDDMGRTIKTMGPEFTSGGSTKRTVNWTVYLDDEHEVRTGQGFKYGSNSYSLITPISITKMNPSGQVTDEIQAIAGGSSVPTGSIGQSTWTRWTHHEYFAEGLLSHTDVYYLIPSSGAGTEGTNFNRTRFGYDVMGRRNYVKSPAGTITRTVYDPRGLVLSVWVGTSDTGATDADPSGGGAGGNNMKPVSINTYDDDAYGTGNASLDGLLTKVTSPVDASSSNDREVKYRYDWRDRQVKMITTDGTNTFEAENVYDNLSRVTNAKETRLGSPNRLIAESVTHYDDWGRVYKTEQKGIDDSGSVTQTLTSNTWYDAENNVIKSFPAGSETFTKSTYDAIGRQTASYTGYYSSGSETPQSVATDVIFEETHTAYDKASNVIHTTTKERWHDATGNGALNGPSGSQPKSRDSYVAMFYDGIGRNIATANYGTNNDAGPPTWPTTVPSSTATRLVSQTLYNTAGEAETQIDPAGKWTYTTYDAAGRVTSTTRNQGASPQEKVEMTYNPDGQLATLTAVNYDTGNQVTTYSYGVTLSGSGIVSNSLLASVDYPDGGDVDYEYNRQGQRIKLTDQNGSVHQYEYDKLGRQTADKVTFVANGVDDSVRMITWSYDNRKRLQKVTSWDAVTSGDETSDVEFAYNSFNQLTTEWQQHGDEVTSGSPKVQYGYANGSMNTIRRESCTYPNGKVLAYDYSAGTPSNLSRVSSLIWDSTPVAAYDYLGLGQVVIQKYPQPSTDVEYTLATGNGSNPYAGLDRFGRIINLQWKQDATMLVDLEYGYDLASNRTYRRDNLGNSARYSELYNYDGLHRLVLATRGELNNDNNAFVGFPLGQQAWGLDATGNWKTFLSSYSPVAGQQRTHNGVNEITDVDQTVGTAWHDPAYDNNGNTTEMPSPLSLATALDGTYDAWNRLVKSDDSTKVVEYAYDGLKRRITKTSSGSTRHYYYSDQWQVLEERLDSNTTADRQYVWGLRYIDDLVLRDSTSERLYALQDALFNVVALTDDDGDVVERFAYQPYGQSEALNPDYTAYNGTDYQWVYRFTGRELDLETGLQINRMRYLHLQLGRWITRDPIGYRGGVNTYQYVNGIPIQYIDPWGLRAPAARPPVRPIRPIRPNRPSSPARPVQPIQPPSHNPEHLPTLIPPSPYLPVVPNRPQYAPAPHFAPDSSEQGEQGYILYPTQLPPGYPEGTGPHLEPSPGTTEWEDYARNCWKRYRADCRNRPEMPPCPPNRKPIGESLEAEANKFIVAMQEAGELPDDIRISATNCYRTQVIAPMDPVCRGGGFTYHCKAFVVSGSGVWVTQRDLVSLFACACCNSQTGSAEEVVKPFGTPSGQGAVHFATGNKDVSKPPIHAR